MAGIVKQFLLLIVFFHVCSQNGQGCALVIELSPKKIDAIKPTAVNVSCIPESRDEYIKEIVLLVVTREDRKPIVVLRPNCDLQKSLTPQGDILVEGHIDEIPNKSFLRISLLDPTEDHAGVYRCVMYYLNGIGIWKEKTSEANLTLDNLETKSLVRYLVHKVTQMDDELKKRSENEKALINQISVLENKLNSQNSEQTKRESELKSNMSALEVRIGNQNLEILDLITKTSENLRSSLSSIEEKMRSHYSTKKHVSIFSAMYSMEGSNNIGDIIVFNEFIVNIGDDYDNKTGLFTAPKTGVYEFHLNAMLKTSHGHIDLVIYVNNNREAGLSMASNEIWDQSSISVFLNLTAQDVLKVCVASKHDGMRIRPGIYTTLTGYLLNETS